MVPSEGTLGGRLQVGGVLGEGGKQEGPERGGAVLSQGKGLGLCTTHPRLSDLDPTAHLDHCQAATGEWTQPRTVSIQYPRPLGAESLVQEEDAGTHCRR